jgi:DNA-binding beta-propeller fold protein YncE
MLDYIFAMSEQRCFSTSALKQADAALKAPEKRVMWIRLFRLVGSTGLAILAFVSCVLAQTTANSGKNPLRTVADFPLPGAAVRFDYQSLDSTSGRLYIAHMNDDHLVIFDTKAREVTANIGGFSRVHGVLVVPEIGQLFASITGEHAVAAFNTQSLRTVAKIGPINYPDGIAYAPGPKRVFVSDEHGNTDAVIDAQSYTLIKKIELGGGAGNTVFDSGSDHIFVAVHEKNELVSIDPVKMEIIGHHPLPGVKEPHGISLDVANRLGFVAGAGNRKLALVDLTNMQVLGTYPVGDDPDVLSFDPGLKQLYVSAESGNVWVYREDGKSLKEVGHFFMPHAHTVCADPKTHLVYFPLESIDGHPLLRIMEPVSK